MLARMTIAAAAAAMLSFTSPSFAGEGSPDIDTGPWGSYYQGPVYPYEGIYRTNPRANPGYSGGIFAPLGYTYEPNYPPNAPFTLNRGYGGRGVYSY